VVVEINKVDAFLQHFSAQPYDPVKAHEYYLRNRQLQGRKTSGMSDKQKEAWAYSKDQVANDKKAQMEIAKVSNAQKIEAFQKKAEETRVRISEKLKLLSEKLTKEAEINRDNISDNQESINEQITKEAKRKQDNIADKLKSDIANVPPIPKNISGAQRAILVERRNKEIANIRDAASSDRDNLNDDTKISRKTNSEAASDNRAEVTDDAKSDRKTIVDDASGEREKTRTDLKALIATTRDTYTKEKAKMIADYETTYQKEYDKVLSTVAGKPKSNPKSKGKGKDKSEGNNKGIIYYNGKGPTR
jgi:hypothetical protein